MSRCVQRLRNKPFLLEGLEKLCQQFVGPETVMAEIGCYAGESTLMFSQHAKLIHAIDPWSGSPENTNSEIIFDFVTRRSPNIHKIKRRSEEVYQDFPNRSLDLVYLDGDHSYAAVKRDLTLWLPKVKKGGCLAGHDWDFDWSTYWKNPIPENFPMDIPQKFHRHPVMDSYWGYNISPESKHNPGIIWPGITRAVLDVMGEPHHVFEDSSYVFNI